MKPESVLEKCFKPELVAAAIDEVRHMLGRWVNGCEVSNVNGLVRFTMELNETPYRGCVLTVEASVVSGDDKAVVVPRLAYLECQGNTLAVWDVTQLRRMSWSNSKSNSNLRFA